MPDNSGYLLRALEYQSDANLPPNPKLDDPSTVTRLLERTRQSILSRPCLCGKPTCGNVGCPCDDRTYLPAADCDCWADPDEDLNGFPSWEQLHPFSPTAGGRICLLNPTTPESRETA